jgi:hypothetical protein
MTPKIMHVFYEIHLGASHGTLGLILEEKLKKTALDKGEVAVFLNKSWTGAKLLTAGGHLLYWRSPYGRPITPEELRYLPAAFGGSRMVFTENLESKLIGQFDSVIGKTMKKIRAVKSA